jgi:hypothetical protein
MLFLQPGEWRVTATAPGLVSDMELTLGVGEQRAITLDLTQGSLCRVEIASLPADAHPVEVVVVSSFHVDKKEYFRGVLGQTGMLSIPGLPQRALDLRLTASDGWVLERTLVQGQREVVAEFPELAEVAGRVTWKGRDYPARGAQLKIRGLKSGWQSSQLLEEATWEGLLVPQEPCSFRVKTRGQRDRGARVPLETIRSGSVRVELDYKTRVQDGIEYAESR